jgi:hypothetical protein
MKRSILVTLFLLPIALHAQQRLLSFDDLLSALANGKNVRVVIHYAKCQLVIDSVEQKAPDAIGGMDLSTFEYFAPGVVHPTKGYLASSKAVLIHHPRHGYVQNYVRLRAYDDGTVEITARYLVPGTMEVVMDETFHGRLSAGNDDEGVSFFAN